MCSFHSFTFLSTRPTSLYLNYTLFYFILLLPLLLESLRFIIIHELIFIYYYLSNIILFIIFFLYLILTLFFRIATFHLEEYESSFHSFSSSYQLEPNPTYRIWVRKSEAEMNNSDFHFE